MPVLCQIAIWYRNSEVYIVAPTENTGYLPSMFLITKFT